EGRTIVPIKMKVNQSWFVVFSDSQIETGKGYDKNFTDSAVVQTLEMPWTVDFKNKQIGPKEPVSFSKLTDWIANDNEKIKYYSGTAVYKSTFKYTKNDKAQDLFIDLGKVGVMASVKINGIDIGTTWMFPYKLNANGSVKEGENTIEIEVVNVWRNRMTGDKSLPDANKTTWVLVDKITPEEELIPSGLLGPVTIQVINKK
ncbi:MAG TPA: hypothetical protein DCS17_03575, partial [Flavobacterium sp.]|nr:hypothetical protein [Flavobacterium sp.]